MKKILLLALMLGGAIWGQEYEKTQAELAKERGAPKGLDPQELYSDIFQVANDLFNLKNEKKPAKFSQNDIDAKVKLLTSYIEDAASYIKTNIKGNSIISTNLNSYNSGITGRLSAVRSAELANNTKLISEELLSIYKIANTYIEGVISELNAFKPSDSGAEQAKKLALNIFKLLQNIGNKIIADYTFSPGEVSEEINTDVTYVFMKADWVKSKGVRRDKSDDLKRLFTKLGYLVNFANDGFKTPYKVITALYMSTIDAINDFSEAFKNNEPLVFQEGQHEEKESLREFLNTRASDIKNTINKAVDNLTTKTAADKNAKAILQLLLKLYEPILKKIEKEFDYKSAMKKAIDSITFKGNIYSLQTLGSQFQQINALDSQLQAFIGSEGKYNKDKYNSYQECFVRIYDLMTVLYSERSTLESKERSEKSSTVNKYISSMNEELKNAGVLIDKISESKVVRSILKDLLSKYKDFINKFEDDMRTSLKLTFSETVKSIFSIGGKKRSAGEELTATYTGGKRERIKPLKPYKQD